jgi:solute carrier family 25 iron transporter 28/37
MVATQTVTEGRAFPGFVYAVKSIYHQHGLKGFLRGWSARMMFTAPAGAISWSVYEFFKHFLHIADTDGSDERPAASVADFAKSVNPANAVNPVKLQAHAYQSDE